MINRTITIALLMLFMCGVPLLSFAAPIDVMSITTNPPVPGPNQDVTINLKSFVVNLDTATIIWYVNKVPEKQGIAQKSFLVHTGDFGQVLTVDIVIIPENGEKINKQIVIAPAEVDLLWEAQTYTPPFYRGKALPSAKSMIRVTAIPRFNALSSDPKQYVYKWTYNRTLSVGGGLGQNSTLVPLDWSNIALPVSVDVTLPGTNFEGSQNIVINGTDPLVVFYEQAPLLGTQFDHAIKESVNASANTFVVRAVPYYFSTEDYLGSGLLYNWYVDQRPTVPGQDQMEITVAKSGKDAEASSLNLRVQNPKRVLQSGGAATLISFQAE